MCQCVSGTEETKHTRTSNSPKIKPHSSKRKKKWYAKWRMNERKIFLNIKRGEESQQWAVSKEKKRPEYFCEEKLVRCLRFSACFFVSACVSVLCVLCINDFYWQDNSILKLTLKTSYIPTNIFIIICGVGRFCTEPNKRKDRANERKTKPRNRNIRMIVNFRILFDVGRRTLARSLVMLQIVFPREGLSSLY